LTLLEGGEHTIASYLALVKQLSPVSRH